MSEVLPQLRLRHTETLDHGGKVPHGLDGGLRGTGREGG